MRSRIRSATVDIAMVGKYVDLTESYKSLSEALTHAGIHTRSSVQIHYVDSEADRARRHRRAEGHGRDPRARRLRQARRRGQDRARSATRARTRHPVSRHLPRHAARGHRVRAAQGAGSPTRTARNSIRDTPHPVVALITEWQNRDGTVEKRSAESDLGGTMRLGAQPCDVVPGSLAHRIYGATTVAERHRHRYEVNNHYLPRLEAAGLVVGARARARPPAICARWSSCRAIRGSSAASSTRSSRRIRGAAIRCSSGFVERARAQQRREQCRRRGAAARRPERDDAADAVEP